MIYLVRICVFYWVPGKDCSAFYIFCLFAKKYEDDKVNSSVYTTVLSYWLV